MSKQCTRGEKSKERVTCAFFVNAAGGSEEPIGHFRITFGLFFKASLDAHLFIWKLVFICMWMKANFHMKRWAPGLALKKRPKVIRKWPIVIGKSKSLRCFKAIKDRSQLPCSYVSQAKSWMDFNILDEVLSKLNRKLARKQRNVILFLDNAPCHPPDMKVFSSKLYV